ncbi:MULTISPECIES: ABC transporter substrate-binding protein [unclassified Chelatococcus]|uniref:ABC transporter substrate-binding protein n=1 Tax=unclassified Chelatococcus TaxID=2638111 RepID=UPI001BCD397A|nr:MULTISPECIES: ABC transporter substrate-binding protein [unclassified Chelatococcus]CAH1652427.1 Peptide/nickel transport system substrate-binding protein [Hyphomicrobiales bacterium]MBS7743035.1 ABC transporter substrate-binding protein [Chelatococcus sp. HY11]MBX3541847.1 ABC transporter substrate-binding protein [Chelatococcus sp.]MCO5074262.1 ABC transporter substrate-binding protein [Chelatococcus sp.]CAH1693842.1 Peptide/nickel transport system substrate-binding protein [Hyphomicrobia
MNFTTRVRAGSLSVASVLIALFTAGFTTAAAQDLRIATSYKLMTLDPHFSTLNENSSLLSHIFERLVYQDEKLALQPGLATSWKRVSDTRWEFKLRENVRFHDGSPFTADDVVYTIERIRNFLKPPSGGFQAYTKGIASVSATDPTTVVIETVGSQPTLPLALSAIFILPRGTDGFATTEKLNAGTSLVGTGPYKFKAWRSGETLDLTRNDDYWGQRPAWSNVSFRIVESPAARVAALSAGDVDIADFVPARDVETLKQRGAKVESVPAARLNFFQFELGKEAVPGVTDKSDKAIANPFLDARVRKALAMAVDRNVIVDKILSGYGTAAAQFFPNGLAGTSPNLAPQPARYEEAKALLAEAGFPNGFKVVLNGPAGRYPGDGESLQAVAQSWARIGVAARPVGVPFSVFNTKRAAGEYSIWYGGCSGEAVDVCLEAVLKSPDNATGAGALNFGQYRNPAYDEMLDKARTVDAGLERDKALAELTDFVMGDEPIIPLYHFHHISGYGPRVTGYLMHPRGWTTAMQAKPAAN